MYSNLYEMSRIEKPIIRDIKEITTRARRFGRKWGVTSKSFCGEWWKLFEIRADGDTTLYKKNNWTVYFKWTNHMVYENCSVVSDSLQPHGLSMEFSRQEYWIGLPFPSPRYLPDPGIKPGSPALQADSLPSEPQTAHLSEHWKHNWYFPWKKCYKLNSTLPNIRMLTSWPPVTHSVSEDRVIVDVSSLDGLLLE